MKRLLTLFFFACLCAGAKAGDSIEIKMNKFSFPAKDSIEFACTIPDYGKRKMAAVTLNVWIQDLEKKQTWKYRYPVLNGEVSCALAIGDSIKPGKYAINFILQQGLFRINGMLKNNFSHKSLNYMMLSKSKQPLFNNVSLDPTGAFTIKNIVFQDEAFFVFTPGTKVKRNDLFINAATPLDSAFIPLALFTQIIDVKPELQKKTEMKDPPYVFDFTKTFINTTLPDVVVTYKGKSKIEQYDDTYTSGLFKDNNARVFDGLNNEEISSFLDIPSFLQTKIPGLRIEKDNNDRMIWREEPLTVYIDEYKLEDGDPIFVFPSEVAMIKVFPPPAAMNSGSSFGGAVAIYTKKGDYDNNTTHKFKFYFKGYNGLDGVWR
jgi:hypothetical protein